MASTIDKIKNDIIEAVNASQKQTSAYDTEAEVVRIDGNTAWVHIAGGVSETPVAMTINAQKGDKVQVRVSNEGAWLMGNATSPPTDDTKANTADARAGKAVDVADQAWTEAESAHEAADAAWSYADNAQASATRAETSATEAKASAENASEYASRALGNLSTVQSVAETLTWITQHGTMALTTDTVLDPTHVYFVRDNDGDYEVGAYKYSIVAEPDVADIATYYELTIDESLNNYVGTHLALTNEGLWLLPASSGTNKVLIATGAGSSYTIAGTYIIGSSGETLASFRNDGLTVQAYDDNNNSDTIAHLGYGTVLDNQGLETRSKYFTLGIRKKTTLSEYPIGSHSLVAGSGVATQAGSASFNSSYALGLYSHSEGYSTVASGDGAHAEGDTDHSYSSNDFVSSSGITASGDGSHAEGYSVSASGQPSFDIIASGNGSHAEGYASDNYGDIKATGKGAHAQNAGTQALSDFQTAIGRCNNSDADGKFALIIGNGTDRSHKSNALAVEWDGSVRFALDTSAQPDTIDGKLYSAIDGLNWNDVIVWG